jgi:hypothetical protein
MEFHKLWEKKRDHVFFTIVSTDFVPIQGPRIEDRLDYRAHPSI